MKTKKNIVRMVAIAVILVVISVSTQAQIRVWDGNHDTGLSVGVDYFVNKDGNSPRPFASLDYRSFANIFEASFGTGIKDGKMNNLFFKFSYNREFGKWYKNTLVPSLGVYASAQQGAWTLSEKIDSDVLLNAGYNWQDKSYYPAIGVQAGLRIRTASGQAILIKTFAQYGFPQERVSDFKVNIHDPSGNPAASMKTVGLTKPEALSFGVSIAYRFSFLPGGKKMK